MTTKVWDAGAWVDLAPDPVFVETDFWFPTSPYVANAATGSSTVLLDASGEYVSWVFQAPRTGTIDRLRFNGGGLTTNPSTADCRLETVDAATGLPTGTLAGTTANGSVSITAANSSWEATLTTPLAVTQGQWLCFKVAWASGNFNVLREPNAGIATTFGGLYGVQSQGGVTGRFHNGPHPFGIRYNNGLYERLSRSIIALGTITNNYQDATNPDERGIKMTIPFDCKASGMWFAKGTSTGNRTLKFYDSSTTLLWSLAWDADFQSGTNPLIFLRFSSDIDLVGGADYRLTCLATEAVNIQVNEITAPSGLGHAFAGGTGVVWTQRNNSGGSWTDTTDKIAAMGLLISGVYAPS